MLMIIPLSFSNISRPESLTSWKTMPNTCFELNTTLLDLKFAKSRGQIHVHLLEVLEKKSIIEDLNELV
jgi:hypothetical protein